MFAFAYHRLIGLRHQREEALSLLFVHRLSDVSRILYNTYPFVICLNILIGNSARSFNSLLPFMNNLDKDVIL
jgi:hypothetical protein